MTRKITFMLATLLFGTLNLLAQGIQFETSSWKEVVEKMKSGTL